MANKPQLGSFNKRKRALRAFFTAVKQALRGAGLGNPKRGFLRGKYFPLRPHLLDTFLAGQKSIAPRPGPQAGHLPSRQKSISPVPAHRPATPFRATCHKLQVKKTPSLSRVQKNTTFERKNPPKKRTAPARKYSYACDIITPESARDPCARERIYDRKDSKTGQHKQEGTNNAKRSSRYGGDQGPGRRN